jgi:hypothetical protein
MIQCPRCGAFAQWGAPACPNCQAQFVAPPAQFATGAPTLGQLSRPTNRSRIWLVAAGVLALGGIGLLGLKSHSNPTGGSARRGVVPHAEMLHVAPERPAPAIASAVDVPETSQGIFKVVPQAEQPPVVAIGNHSLDNFRLQLEDANGYITTEWIPAGLTREITVKAGHYNAMIDAPNDTKDVPTRGEVNVKDFRHYEADFVIVPANQSQDFYIGD